MDSNYSKCQGMRNNGTLMEKTFQKKQVLSVSFKSKHANLCVLYRHVKEIPNVTSKRNEHLKDAQLQFFIYQINQKKKKCTSFSHTLLAEPCIHIFLVGMQNGTTYKERSLAISNTIM